MRIIVVLLAFLSSMSLSLSAHAVLTVGDVAAKFHVGGLILTKLMWVGCFVIGGILIAMAIGYIQSHINNPKAVPLDRVLMYFIFGLVLVMVPFLGRILGIATGSPMDLKSEEHKHNPFVRHNIDSPDHHKEYHYEYPDFDE